MLTPSALGSLTSDGRLLFVTRTIRLFAYGALSVVLVFYLVGLGLSEPQIGVLLTLTLAGDTVVSMLLTTRADRFGRRRTLMAGALLMAGAGLTFAWTSRYWLLLVAGILGVISPSGNEVGPFLPIEQAALSQVLRDRARTEMFGWYALAGSLATAIGSLAGGALTRVPGYHSADPVAPYRGIVVLYAVLGVALVILFSRLSPAAEATVATVAADRPLLPHWLGGLHRSRRVVMNLSGLFALDAFAGGFVVQSFAAYWFHLRFGIRPDALGAIFFGANLLAGLSALVAARLAARFGLIRTMVATHVPSNVLLALVPLMPTLPLAVLVLLVRFSISQMDVPTRQSYVMAVVAPDERSAAAGITGVARTLGAALSPWCVGLLFAHASLVDVPFYLAGALKIVYDLVLYRQFVTVVPPEERTGSYP